jgi:micrococcal nuclease
MYEYKCKIVKVVDGDTVDVDIDLGFGCWLKDERVRIMGIDTPESRTSDKVEKIFGLKAKERLNSLLGANAILQTQVSKNGENMKGKFGRILGNFLTEDGSKVCADVLVAEGHAVHYSGGSKDATTEQHMINRQRLVDEGVVPCPPGMSSNNVENEAVKMARKEDEVIIEKIVELVVPKSTKKKRKLLCLSLYKKSFFQLLKK